MSKRSRQHGLGSFTGQHPHLQRPHLSERPPSTGVKLSADPDNSEAWCVSCDNRVTVGDKEYGHTRACPHAMEGQR